jgi:hypothetical protein
VQTSAHHAPRHRARRATEILARFELDAVIADQWLAVALSAAEDHPRDSIGEGGAARQRLVSTLEAEVLAERAECRGELRTCVTWGLQTIMDQHAAHRVCVPVESAAATPAYRMTAARYALTVK